MASRQGASISLSQFEVTLMNNLKAFQNIDTNRPASTKQLYLVAGHFAKLHGNSKLYKVFGAILQKFNAEHLETPITMGDVSKFLEMQKVPVKFTKLVQKPKTKAKPTVSKVQVKLQAPKPKVSKEKPTVSKTKTKATVSKPKASEMSVEDFKKRLETLVSKTKQHDAQFIEAEKRMTSLEAKFDAISAQFEAFLTTDADKVDY